MVESGPDPERTDAAAAAEVQAEVEDAPDRLRWLLLTVSTAGAPATLRVHAWRQLRSLGALYLQQSVCLLPDRPAVTRAVRRLLGRIGRDGGQARLLHITLADAAEQAQVIQEFRSQRAAEYAEVLERTPALLEEIASERARGRATYAEVEESEADLERFQSWLAKIAARDYFGAPNAAEARAAVERCAQALAAFEEEALAAEAPDPSPVTQPQRAARLRVAEPGGG
jgi:hypothetical protein